MSSSQAALFCAQYNGHFRFACGLTGSVANGVKKQMFALKRMTSVDEASDRRALLTNI